MMKKLLLVSFLLSLIAHFPTFAGGKEINSAVRSDDTLLEGEGKLEQMLVGKTITWQDGAKSIFYSDGKYSYRNSRGLWAGKGEYKIFPAQGYCCIVFLNDHSRCDKYVLNNEGKLTSINWSGERYPAK